MTLVTTCPSCSTQFFVTQAQLTSHKGKVRCGQCKHVFNANKILHEIASSEQNMDEISAEILAKTSPATVAENEPIEIQTSEQTAETILPEELVLETPHAGPPLEEVAVENPVIEDLPVVAPQAVEPIIKPEQVEAEPLQIEDYFAASSKLKNKVSKKAPRWLIVLLLLILLPLTICQSIYYFRTPIASQLPGIKPYLVQACKWFDCKVALPKQLESLAIDDSEMREDANYEHVLQFSITLINKANIALRYPSIELTLTDANDETIIRRTFTPHEYLVLNHNPAIGNVEAGFAAKDRLHIKLALNTNDVTVAGYRLELVD